MGMFDPIYATEVFNDIASRRGREMVITPKETQEAPPKSPEQSA